MAEGSDERTLEVTVERVIFRDVDDGFTVLRVVGDRSFVAAGAFPLTPQIGDALRIRGSFGEHPRFGRRFSVAEAQPLLPATAEGIRRYLASGRVKGIGPKLARRVVDHFGPETLEVLETAPERVLEVPGVGRNKLEEIRRTFAEGREQREALVHLQGLGLGPGLALAVWRAWSGETIARVQSNPYDLVEAVEGIGFATADRVARESGIAIDAPERLTAGLRHVLRRALDQGHLCLEGPELIARTAQLLELPSESVRSVLATAVEADALAAVAPRLPEFASAGPPRIYIPVLLATEEEAARRLLALDAHPGIVDAARGAQLDPARLDARLSAEQQLAVKALLGSKVSLLTGGPGVGKTTVMRAVTRALRSWGLRVALASPTGRAAKQLEAATGFEASTLHRLFGFVPGVAETGRAAPLDADVLIIDETSMLDLPLFLRVLRRLPDELVLILVGDPDQLPSVGPGNVLADIITSRRFTVAHLREIHRQDRHGLIVENAHRILDGELPRLPPRGVPSDFYFTVRETPEEGAALVQHLFLERIPQRFGIDPRAGVQVLSPMHRGSCGVDALNTRLQEGLNPGDTEVSHRGRSFRVGDRVMQTRNDHDRGIMNGELGVVSAAEPIEGALHIRFDDQEERYQAAQLDDLQLAFAMTVHKSQGGEFPAVILPLFTDHALMLRRNVLYTAVTRARDLLVIVGTRKALQMAVSDDRLTRRHGSLLERLQGHPIEAVPVG